MDRFENARVFAAVVEAASFTAGAERLGLSRAAASKHVLALEERLGAKLLNRTTRKVSATEAGRAFYAQCRRILAELDDAERAAGELHNEPRGELRVIAPTNFGLAEIGTAISDLIVAYPRLRIFLTFNDRVTDPIEEGYDVAISVGPPRGTSSSLVVRKLNSSRRILCASPDYLSRRGVPKKPEDLSSHSCLSYSYLDEPDEWHLIGRGGERVVKVSGPIITSHGQILRTAAVRGLGIAYGPIIFFHDDLQVGRVVRVLPQYQLPEAAIYAVYPAGRQLSAKVKAFNDFMAHYFAENPLAP
ncbi:MAG TPA: LysR family transcriptional regulator [Xanthobacteraceae bacterium]|jgi:DNA-binding transcriptional LysR family regulator|nr:LysR family transcriptional regulator [Xanthobacteraceae bacterium]